MMIMFFVVFVLLIWSFPALVIGDDGYAAVFMNAGNLPVRFRLTFTDPSLDVQDLPVLGAGPLSKTYRFSTGFILASVQAVYGEFLDQQTSVQTLSEFNPSSQVVLWFVVAYNLPSFPDQCDVFTTMTTVPTMANTTGPSLISFVNLGSVQPVQIEVKQQIVPTMVLPWLSVTSPPVTIPSDAWVQATARDDSSGRVLSKSCRLYPTPSNSLLNTSANSSNASVVQPISILVVHTLYGLRFAWSEPMILSSLSSNDGSGISSIASSSSSMAVVCPTACNTVLPFTYSEAIHAFCVEGAVSSGGVCRCPINGVCDQGSCRWVCTEACAGCLLASGCDRLCSNTTSSGTILQCQAYTSSTLSCPTPVYQSSSCSTISSSTSTDAALTIVNLVNATRNFRVTVSCGTSTATVVLNGGYLSAARTVIPKATQNAFYRVFDDAQSTSTPVTTDVRCWSGNVGVDPIGRTRGLDAYRKSGPTHNPLHYHPHHYHHRPHPLFCFFFPKDAVDSLRAGSNAVEIIFLNTAVTSTDVTVTFFHSDYAVNISLTRSSPFYSTATIYRANNGQAWTAVAFWLPYQTRQARWACDYYSTSSPSSGVATTQLLYALVGSEAAPRLVTFTSTAAAAERFTCVVGCTGSVSLNNASVNLLTAAAPSTVINAPDQCVPGAHLDGGNCICPAGARCLDADQTCKWGHDVSAILQVIVRQPKTLSISLFCDRLAASLRIPSASVQVVEFYPYPADQTIQAVSIQLQGVGSTQGALALRRFEFLASSGMLWWMAIYRQNVTYVQRQPVVRPATFTPTLTLTPNNGSRWNNNTTSNGTNGGSGGSTGGGGEGGGNNGGSGSGGDGGTNGGGGNINGTGNGTNSGDNGNGGIGMTLLVIVAVVPTGTMCCCIFLIAAVCGWRRRRRKKQQQMDEKRSTYGKQGTNGKIESVYSDPIPPPEIITSRGDSPQLSPQHSPHHGSIAPSVMSTMSEPLRPEEYKKLRMEAARMSLPPPRPSRHSQASILSSPTGRSSLLGSEPAGMFMNPRGGGSIAMTPTTPRSEASSRSGTPPAPMQAEFHQPFGSPSSASHRRATCPAPSPSRLSVVSKSGKRPSSPGACSTHSRRSVFSIQVHELQELGSCCGDRMSTGTAPEAEEMHVDDDHRSSVMPASVSVISGSSSHQPLPQQQQHRMSSPPRGSVHANSVVGSTRASIAPAPRSVAFSLSSQGGGNGGGGSRNSVSSYGGY